MSKTYYTVPYMIMIASNAVKKDNDKYISYSYDKKIKKLRDTIVYSKNNGLKLFSLNDDIPYYTQKEVDGIIQWDFRNYPESIHSICYIDDTKLEKISADLVEKRENKHKGPIKILKNKLKR